MTYELDYPIPQIPENLKKDKEVRIKHSNDALKKLELVAPHLLQSHELSATNYEECSHVLVNDVPVRPNTFLFRKEETTDIVLKWGFEKAYQNYHKVNINIYFDSELIWTNECKGIANAGILPPKSKPR